MGKSRNSDWPAVFFLLLLVGALLTAFTPLPAKGQQPPLREGCRATVRTLETSLRTRPNNGSRMRRYSTDIRPDDA